MNTHTSHVEQHVPGTLAPLFLGVFAVTAGFGVWGMLLLNGNKK